MTPCLCRHCGYALDDVFLDLGHAPLSNGYISADALRRMEKTYPLRIFVCGACRLVQTEDYAGSEEIFDAHYAYFSSVSRSWLDHAARYAGMITERLKLGGDSFVVEVASNDGYLLRNFVDRGIPCLGIEPTAGTAAAAEALGIPVERAFFGEALALRLVAERGRADLVCGNNVYAHVPDINDFTRGLSCMLKPEGVVTLEYPHLLNMMRLCQFDTVYHEHFSYLSLGIVRRIFEGAGLRVFDVEELPTHGGSLRVYGCLKSATHVESESVRRVLSEEVSFGLNAPDVYASFQARAEKIKDDLLTFLIEAKRAGKTVAAYGAAAKGNTLLNFAGVRPDLIAFVCDAAPSKQGKFLPGSHIPILSPDALMERRPDFVLILPWNICDEIISQYGSVRDWGGRFAVAVPKLELI